MDPESNEKQPQEADPTSIDIGSLLKLIDEKEAKLVAIERKRRANALSSAVVVLAGSMLGVFVTTFSSLTADVGRIKISTDTAQSRSKLNQLEARIRSLESSVDKSRVLSPNNSGFAPAKITKDLEMLNNRMNSLSTAILTSPESAIAMPLLRRDIDGISKRIEEYRNQVKSEIDRLYEQQKWMLTGIGTVLLGVAGGAISLILRSLPRGDNESA
jgi:archaellum component FlaC